MPARVSVIIPAFNSERYIADTIASALAQNYRPKEIVVVDDGSTDDTAAELAQFGDRIKVVRQENSGAGAARNRAVKESSGEWIAFLDSDDLWLPHKLERQMQCIEAHPEADFAYHNWHVTHNESADAPSLLAEIEAAGVPERDRAESATCELGWLYNELLLDCVVHTTAVMMRRSLFDAVGGFDETIRQGQDYDLWLRASRKSIVAKHPATLSVYRIRSGSITTGPRSQNNRVRIVERALAQWGLRGPDGRVTEQRVLDRMLALRWREFGYGHLKRGDGGVAVDAYRRAIGYQPLNLNGWLNLMRSIAKVQRERF